jgi:hypothetical protein
MSKQPFGLQKPISVDWYTPEWIFTSLGIEFDLDVASPIGDVPWIPAKSHYDILTDGLTSDWFGRVWLNPPYGGETGKFLKKMHSHRNGIALVYSRTDCGWFHDFASKADAILFLKGRVKFIDGLKLTGAGGAACGSMLIAWGADNVQALERMAHKGFLIKNV